MTTVFSRRGLIAEHGASWLLPRVIGLSRALDVLWSARKVSADEAYRIGLADRVVPQADLLGAVAAYADELAATVAPRSLAVMKQQVLAGLEQSFGAAQKRAPRFARWTGDAGTTPQAGAEDAS